MLVVQIDCHPMTSRSLRIVGSHSEGHSVRELRQETWIIVLSFESLSKISIYATETNLWKMAGKPRFEFRPCLCNFFISKSRPLFLICLNFPQLISLFSAQTEGPTQIHPGKTWTTTSESL